MSKVIAIIGAGPGVGLAIARKFGQEGFKCALISRSLDNLGPLVKTLDQHGIEARAFSADVRNFNGLGKTLEAVIEHFGHIDVLEYSPTPKADMLRPPSEMDVENEQFHLDTLVLGAITAVRAVLPGMLERQSGALLFTTAASAQHPVTFTASFGVAAGAQLNYVRVLNQELMPKGIYAGIVAIPGLIVPREQAGGTSPKGLPLIAPEEVADAHWNLYNRRHPIEAFAGDVNALLKLGGH